MNSLSKPVLSSNYMLYKEDGEIKEYYLFNVGEGNVFQLNSASYDFLELCNGKCTSKEIYEELSKMYSIDISVLKNDFSELYSNWIDSGIIVEQ